MLMKEIDEKYKEYFEKAKKLSLKTKMKVIHMEIKFIKNLLII